MHSEGLPYFVRIIKLQRLKCNMKCSLFPQKISCGKYHTPFKKLVSSPYIHNNKDKPEIMGWVLRDFSMNYFYNYLEMSIQTRIVYLHPRIKSESSMP